MRIEIAEAADFYRTVGPLYDRLCATSGDAGAALEIALSPGTYADIHLSLGASIDPPPIDITVRAADPRQPPVLDNITVNLTGRSVTLDGLVFMHARSGGPVIRLAGTSALTIERSALVDAASLAPVDGQLVELVSVGGHGRATVAIRNSWFIRNWATGGSMLVCVTAPPHVFGSIVIDTVAFLDNHADVSIAAGATGLVQFTNCVVCEPMSVEVHTQRQETLVDACAADAAIGVSPHPASLVAALAGGPWGP